MIVEAWRQRNKKWAARHLTKGKSELLQRRWNRISRFGALRFSLLAGTAIALWFELCLLARSFVLGSIQQSSRVLGPGFVIHQYVLRILPAALIVGIFVAAVYYQCAREYANLLPREAD